MTVCIAHAESDRAVAEALEKFLERRGLFVELENGERAFRTLQGADMVVALWSKEAVNGAQRLSLERRALEAWADDRLILIKLDGAFAPVGLRDLKAIDAAIAQQRDIAWAAAAKRAHEAAERTAGEAPSETPENVARRMTNPAGFAVVLLPLVFLLVGAGLYALATLRPDLLATALPKDAYRRLLPMGGALLAFVLIGVMFLFARARTLGRGAGAAETGRDPLIVCYAPADNTAVLPVVEAAQAQGRAVWIDKGDRRGGAHWAGEIVRAIVNARGVIVMCSAHAFESDHVKREIYLADRYKKPLLPVFLEAIAMPEDFASFLAGVKRLDLHMTPEGERAAAIAQALRTV